MAMGGGVRGLNSIGSGGGALKNMIILVKNMVVLGKVGGLPADRGGWERAPAAEGVTERNALARDKV